MSEDMAKEWACASGQDGFANRYELETEDLSFLYLTRGEYHILNWLAILLENRTFRLTSDLMRESKEYVLSHFLPPYREYDVIVGWRADDSYFAFASQFLNGGISIQQLGRAMELGRLGEQVVLRSEEAFRRLCFCGASEAAGKEWYPRANGRDRKAREDFRAMRSDRRKGNYILDILREEWTNDDARLQRIVSG